MVAFSQKGRLVLACFSRTKELKNNGLISLPLGPPVIAPHGADPPVAAPSGAGPPEIVAQTQKSNRPSTMNT
jgi:hypothetical protein